MDSEASILIKKQFYASSIQPLHPSHLIVTSPTDPRPLRLRATLQASYHRNPKRPACRKWRPLSSLVACCKRWRLPLARLFLQGRMIDEIVLSQAPNKVLMATPPPIDPTAVPILPKALSQLLSNYCSRLNSYRHSVDWANDPTCPDSHSTDHMVALHFSCPTHPTFLVPGDMWVAPLHFDHFLAVLSQFSNLPQLLLSLLNLLPAGPHHLHLTPSPPSQFTSGSEVIFLLRYPTTSKSSPC